MLHAHFRKLATLIFLFVGLFASAVHAQPYVDMVEYRNAQFNYFFYTTRAEEQSVLDGVPGWQRTGQSFVVAATSVPGGVPLTRFFFSEIARAKSRGSHFYTGSDDERASLRGINPDNMSAPRLPFDEGLAAFVYPTTTDRADAACPIATDPIYRLFRGEPAFTDDGNHRLTRDAETYRSMAVDGWTQEGIAFCSPSQYSMELSLDAIPQVAGVRAVFQANVIVLNHAIYRVPGQLELPVGTNVPSAGQIYVAGEYYFKVVGVATHAPLIVNVERPATEEVLESLSINSAAMASSFASATFEPNPVLFPHAAGTKLKAAGGCDDALFTTANISRDKDLRICAKVDGEFVRLILDGLKTKILGYEVNLGTALGVKTDMIDLEWSRLRDILDGKGAIESASIKLLAEAELSATVKVERTLEVSQGSLFNVAEFPLGTIKVPLGPTGVVLAVPLKLVLREVEAGFSGEVVVSMGRQLSMRSDYGYRASSGKKEWYKSSPFTSTPLATSQLQPRSAQPPVFAASGEASLKIKAGIEFPLLLTLGGAESASIGVGAALLGRAEVKARATSESISAAMPVCMDYSYGIDFELDARAQLASLQGKWPLLTATIVGLAPIDLDKKCPPLSSTLPPRRVSINPLRGREGETIRVTVMVSASTSQDVARPPELSLGGAGTCVLDTAARAGTTTFDFSCTLGKSGLYTATATLHETASSGGHFEFFRVEAIPQIDSITPEATLYRGTEGVIVVRGKALGSTLGFSMTDCPSPVSRGGDVLQWRFACTPTSSGEKIARASLSVGSVASLTQKLFVMEPAATPSASSVASVSPLAAKLNEVARFTVTGTRLDAGISMDVTGCAEGMRPRQSSPGAAIFECPPREVGVKSYAVRSTSGALLKSGTIVVSAPTIVNRAPVVGISNHETAVAPMSAFSGVFSIRDDDGDQVINLSVVVKRLSDGATCRINVGSPGAPQAAGDKAFSGCATLATTAGSYELRAEGSDYRTATASAGLPAVPASGYLVQVAGAPPPTPTVTHHSPTTATLNVYSTFTYYGTNLYAGMGFTLNGCSTTPVDLGGTNTARSFGCTPTISGPVNLIVKTAPGVIAELYRGIVTVSNTSTLVNGVCGSASSGQFTSAPTTNLCATGTPSTVTGTGPWNWTCVGANGGASTPCSATMGLPAAPSLTSIAPSAVNAGTTVPFTQVMQLAGSNLDAVTSIVWSDTGTIYATWTKATNGAWTSSSGVAVTLTQTASLLTVTPTLVKAGDTWTGTHSWTVTVGGAAGTSTRSFAVSRSNPLTPINGVCGSANGSQFVLAPTTNLCSTGTPSAVSGVGPWAWTCAGSNGGTTVPCSAVKSTPAAPSLTGITPTAVNAGTAIPFAQVMQLAGSNLDTVTSIVWSDTGVVYATWTKAANGAWTSSSGVAVTLTQTASLLTVTPTLVKAGDTWTGTHSWTVTVGGAAGTSTRSFAVSRSNPLTPINGVCGSASSGQFTSAPTTNLCATGTSSMVTGTGPWNWTCSGVNGGTNVSCSAAVAPVLPAPVSASVASVSTGIQITWSTVVGATGYKIYRGSSLLATIGSGTQSSYIDATVISGTNYCFAVTATTTFTAPPSESSQRSAGCATFTAGPPPLTAPTGVAASTLTTTSLRVTWNAVSGAESYRVERLGGPTISVVAPTIVYVDTALLAGTSYCYRVQAVRGAEISPQGGDGCAMTLPSPVNGVCGSANGSQFTSAPTANLCSTGTASTVTGAGPWSWTCGGSNGGTNASCSASVALPSVPAPTSIISGGSTVGAPLLGGAFVLEWAASGGATFYRASFQNTASGTTSTQTFSATTTALSAISTVASGQTYDWSVAACNAGGCSAYSSTRRFRRQ